MQQSRQSSGADRPVGRSPAVESVPLPRTTRDPRIETLRGLAILLVVAEHVIGQDSTNGLRLPDDSLYLYASHSLDFVRMPLFTFLSGAVYAMRPISPGSARTFMRGKVRRLLAPLLFVGSVFYLMQALVPGVNTPPPLDHIWRVPLFSYAHFWFLQALFVSFALLVVLELTGQLRTPGRWFAWVMLLAAIESEWSPSTEFFSLNEVPYLLAFLLWGLGAMRFPEFFTRRRLAFLLVVLVGGITLQQAALRHDLALSYLGRNSPLGTVVGLAGTVLLFRAGAVWGPLVWLGQYAYAIYLMHVFGTAGMRIGLRVEGVSALPVLFALCLSAGIAFPILAERVCERFAWSRVLVLGRRATAAPGVHPHPGPVATAL